MTRLSEDNDGEEAALKEKEEGDGLVNILTEEKTLRSSINSEKSNHNTNDKRRHNFRQRKKRSKETDDTAKRFNGCIDEEGKEQLKEGVLNAEDGDVNGDSVNALDAFDEMILENDSSDSSDSKGDDDDKHLVIMSNICLTETEVMYPTLSKDRRTTKLPPEVELMTARKSSSASTDSAQSDEDRDVKRSESFASFGSSIKIAQLRQVRI